MSSNEQLPASDKALVINYVKSLIELYSKNSENFKDKFKRLLYIIYKSDEVLFYVHNETLRCNNQVIGYTSTLILYYRTNNCWNTIPSHIVSEDREASMVEVVKSLLAQIPEEVNN
jgi:uncharacterized protein YqiB (DUF1249 family)